MTIVEYHCSANDWEGGITDEFLPRLTAVSRSVKTRAERALAEHGVHAGQQFLLECLWREDGLTPGELARRIGVETATITREAQRMERTGLVRRLPDPVDARLIRVYLTERGRALESVIPGVLRGLAEAALDGLASAERASLARLLERVQRNLG